MGFHLVARAAPEGGPPTYFIYNLRGRSKLRFPLGFFFDRQSLGLKKFNEFTRILIGNYGFIDFLGLPRTS